MEDIKEKARKEAEEIWENELKKSFSSQINKSLMETLNVLKTELNKFDSSINKHIEDLDKQFDEKWTKKFNDQMSQLEQLKNNPNNNQPNIINQNNNNNNLDNNNNNIFEDNNNIFKNLKKDF